MKGRMTMTFEDQRRLEAAQGYSRLGMHLEANAEIEALNRSSHYLPEVLAVKIAIYRDLEIWDLVDAMAFALSRALRQRAAVTPPAVTQMQPRDSRPSACEADRRTALPLAA